MSLSVREVNVIEVTVVAFAMDRMSPDPAPLTFRYFVVKSPSVALDAVSVVDAPGLPVTVTPAPRRKPTKILFS